MLLFTVAGISSGQFKAKVSISNTVLALNFDDEVTVVIATTTTTNTKRNKRLFGLTVGAGFEREGTIRGRDIRWGMEYSFTDFEEWNFTAGGRLLASPRSARDAFPPRRSLPESFGDHVSEIELILSGYSAAALCVRDGMARGNIRTASKINSATTASNMNSRSKPQLACIQAIIGIEAASAENVTI